MSGGQDMAYQDAYDRREALGRVADTLYQEWIGTPSTVRDERENRAWALTQLDRFAGDLYQQFPQLIRYCYRNKQPGVNIGLHEKCTWLIDKARKAAKCDPLELLP